MTGPRVLIDRGASKAVFPLSESPQEGWRWVGLFGLLMATVGLADIALAYYPPRFGVLEWEFGTVASTFAGLPLVSLGLAGILGSAFARGMRRTLLMMAIVFLVLATLIGAAYVIFVTDVPVALKSIADPEVKLGLKKAAVKTTILGVAFALAYVAAAIGALRRLRAGRVG